MSDQAEGFPVRFAQQVANVTAAENRIIAEGCEYCTDPDGNLCFPTYGLAPHRPTEPNGIRGHEFIEPTHEDGFVPDPESPTHGTYYCTHCAHGKPLAESEVLTLLEMAQRVVSEPDFIARVNYDSWPMAQEVAAAFIALQDQAHS